MSYCVGISTKYGLAFMSDTRTNAGLDDLSQFKKLFTFGLSNDRLFTLLSAGNLATTQAVVSAIDQDSKSNKSRLLRCKSMFEVAEFVGQQLSQKVKQHAENGVNGESKFQANLILGGQIKGSKPSLFLIYPEGNFIEATEDTPFFQIGEIKYGRPILIRAYRRELSMKDIFKLLIVSFDSTLKANLTVGFPLDFQIYFTDTLKSGVEGRLNANDPYFVDVSNAWSRGLEDLLLKLPSLTLSEEETKQKE
jgi:putative proteasome-type protease|tara:strand:- start:27 stop:776 length:750 start_codon:yes stop_codon:yes gene_type:complete